MRYTIVLQQLHIVPIMAYCVMKKIRYELVGNRLGIDTEHEKDQLQDFIEEMEIAADRAA